MSLSEKAGIGNCSWRFSRVEEVARTVEFETENEVEEEVAFDKVDIEEEDDPLISTVRQTTAETTSTTERTSTSTTAAATTTMTTTITATTPRTPASTSTAPEVARRELMNVDMNIISVKFEGPFDPEELYRILNQTTVTFQLFSSVAGAPQLSRRFPEFIFVPGKRPGEGAVENSFVQMVNGGVRMSYHVALQFKASPGKVGEGRGQPPGTRIRTGDGQDYKVLARM